MTYLCWKENSAFHIDLPIMVLDTEIEHTPFLGAAFKNDNFTITIPKIPQHCPAHILCSK
jgi:hypothetical protein